MSSVYSLLRHQQAAGCACVPPHTLGRIHTPIGEHHTTGAHHHWTGPIQSASSRCSGLVAGSGRHVPTPTGCFFLGQTSGSALGAVRRMHARSCQGLPRLPMCCIVTCSPGFVSPTITRHVANPSHRQFPHHRRLGSFLAVMYAARRDGADIGTIDPAALNSPGEYLTLSLSSFNC